MVDAYSMKINIMTDMDLTCLVLTHIIFINLQDRNTIKVDLTIRVIIHLVIRNLDMIETELIEMDSMWIK